MNKFLHQLIASLTTSEKIYFKRSANTHDKKSNKNYLKIYQCLEHPNAANENILQNTFAGTSIGQHLHSECNYLQEKLLLSLFNFHLNGSKRNQIQKGIILIEVLIKKGFRKQALKKLKVVRKNAEKNEELTMLLRLIELEEIILFKEGILGYRDKLLELKGQRNQVTAKIQNLNDYQLIREEIRETQFSENFTANDLTRFNEICEHPLVQDSVHCLTKRAKEHWYYIQVLASYLNWNFEQGLSYSQEYVLFVQEHMHMFSTSKLLPALSNFIYHSTLTRNRPSFDFSLKLLSNISDSENLPKPYVLYIKYTRTLEFAYYTNNSRLSEEYLALTSDLLSENGEEFEETQIQYLYMTIVRATIVLGKFKTGTLIINQWMQRGVLSYRKVQARLFLLIIHFELGYFDLVQSELVMLKKLEKRYSRDQELIGAFYRFFYEVVKHPNKRPLLIETLQHKLKAISQENDGYFDFISFDYFKWSLDLSQRDAAVYSA